MIFILKANISITRIRTFLLRDELDNDQITHEEDEGIV